MLTLDAIDYLVLNVRDVEISAAWYERVLGMRRRNAQAPTGETRTSVLFGPHKINLRPADASTADWFTAQVPTVGTADLCFLTAVPPDDVAEHFRRCDVVIEQGPVTKSGARGPIQSVYVRDPDGNLIEVSSYR